MSWITQVCRRCPVFIATSVRQHLLQDKASLSDQCSKIMDLQLPFGNSIQIISDIYPLYMKSESLISYTEMSSGTCVTRPLYEKSLLDILYRKNPAK